jgi:tetratricopeptide (TPR) repeat protein/tRNA A-37 threonylcarbamoyl transferase component Bud32
LASVEHDLRGLGDGDLEASLGLVGSGGRASQEPTLDRRLDGPGLRYRILRPLAKGGLGEVFVAEDTELHRQVALKEIQAEHAHDVHRRGRFLQEAEITGGLEHPGVVPVYGLGQYADGRPFYAMRFVQGDNLKEAIDRFHRAEQPSRVPGERRLEMRQLLGRFVDVCQAVAYAHSRGVLHRDLKPGNIMLGKYGETLVVDWGLAKTIGRPEGQGSADEATLRPSSGSGEAATQAGSAVGTPAYMSPEQAEGRLAELGPATDVYGLGATLYALLTGRAPFLGREPGEVLSKVRRGEMVPPRRVKAEVPAGLEAICLRAMALRPKDRYASALELAAEVEHWLADEPVAAYREPLAARLGRLARRHPAQVAAVAAAVLVALLAGGGAWLWAAERRAETERAVGLSLGKAELLREQAQKMPGDGPAGAAEVLAVWKQALAAAEQAEAIGAAGLVEEETAGRAAGLLAELRAGRDRAQQALSQARKDARLLAALEEARLAYSVWKGQSFDYPAGAAAYAKAFAAYGLDVRGHKPTQIAQTLRRLPARMRETLAVALDDWALCAPAQEDRKRLRDVASAVDDDPWRRGFRRASDLATLKALAIQARRQSLPAVSLDVLASALLWGTARAEAVALWRQAQQRYPADFWINFNLAAALWEPNRGSKQGLDEAIGYYRAAVARRPGNAVPHNNLGAALKAQGDVAGAIAEFKKAIALHPKFTVSHNNLGTALYTKGHIAGAIAEYKKAIALDPKDALAHTNLGIGMQDQGDVAGAITAYRKAIALDPRSTSAHYSLGTALEAQGHMAGAIAEYRKTIALDPTFAMAHNNLGTALKSQGDLPGAIGEYKKAVALDPMYAQAYGNLGLALHAQGDAAGAIAEFRKAVILDPKNAKAHYNLGYALKVRRDMAGAKAEFRKAIALDPKLAEAHCNLGLALRQQGRLLESLASLRRGLALGARQPGWPFPSARWVNQAERLVELDKQLPAFLKRERQPRNAAETLELAAFCQQPFKQLYAAAARYYREAFAAQPKLAEALRAGHRYHAACAAALAGCGQGKDAAPPDAKQRSRLRRQALAWLRADLSAWHDLLQKTPKQAQSFAGQTVRHWQQDTDLAGVRDQAGLAKLPERERQEWAKLWADVAALLVRSQGSR